MPSGAVAQPRQRGADRLGWHGVRVGQALQHQALPQAEHGGGQLGRRHRERPAGAARLAPERVGDGRADLAAQRRHAGAGGRVALGVQPQLHRQQPPAAVLVGQVAELVGDGVQLPLEGQVVGEQRLDPGEVLVAVALEGGHEQLLLAVEVGVQRADGEAGLLGDVVHGRAGVALAGEHPRGRPEQLLAGGGLALGPAEPWWAGHRLRFHLRFHSDHYYSSDRYPSTVRSHRMFDVVIAGGGPAGLNAALMLGRARRNVLLADSGQPRNKGVHAMHGFLSRDGTDPAALRQTARDQLGAYPTVRVRDLAIQAVVRDAEQFTISLADGSSEQARRLLLATGVADQLPPIPGLAELWGRGVFNCPYCDGWEVRDQPLAVLAANPRNVQLALQLTRWSPDVLLCSNGPAELDDDTRRLLT